jgi:hypothetical protein
MKRLIFAALAVALACDSPTEVERPEPAYAVATCGTNPHWPAKANSQYPFGTLRYVWIDGIRYVYGVPGRAPTTIWKWLEYEIDARRFTVEYRSPTGWIGVALTCRVPGFWVTMEPVAVTPAALHLGGWYVKLAAR